jgi:glycosyltransferase involved in cell wall biosynthesis
VLHPWALQPRGAERTFFELARALPTADVFFLHYDPRVLPPDIEARVEGASFLHREPWRRLPYRAMLPFLPTAVESLRLTRYDVVVSSSFGWTHGALTGDVATHVSYMHSPPRYLWDEPPPSRGARALGPVLQPVLHQLRMWDRLAADRVDHFLANSRRTERRIAKRYARSAEVLHPPVDVARFGSVRSNPGGHLVTVGELVPYKRFDLAVRAAKATQVRLVVVGEGPERARL